MTNATRRIIHKWINLISLILFSLLLQTTLLSRFSVFSCTPSLLPFIVAAVALVDGMGTGAATGLIAGFLCDAVFGGYEGFYTVVLPVLAVVICIVDKFMYWKNYGMSVLNWVLLLILHSVIYFCIFLLIEERGTFVSIFYVLPGEILATAPFTPFLYMIVSRISKSAAAPDDV